MKKKWIAREFISLPDDLNAWQKWMGKSISIGDILIAQEDEKFDINGWRDTYYGHCIRYSSVPNSCIRRLKLTEGFKCKLTKDPKGY